MRFWMYFFALLLYVVVQLVSAGDYAIGERLRDLWYFAFLAVCIDFGYRIRHAIFVFFPVYQALNFLYLFLELPAKEVLFYTDGLVHLVLGGMFFMISRRIRDLDDATARLFYFTAVGWIVLSGKLLLMVDGFQFLYSLYQFNIFFYLLAALLGRIMSSPHHYSFLKDEEYNFTGFTLFFCLIVIIRDFIDNIAGVIVG